MRAPRRKPLRPRNVTVAGRYTSVRLEPDFWDALRQAAELQGRTVSDILTEVDQSRSADALTRAIRVYVLRFYRAGGSV